METYEQTIQQHHETREHAALIMAEFECEGFIDLDELDFLEGEAEQ